MAFRLSKNRDVKFNDIDETGRFEIVTTIFCDTVSDLPGQFDIDNYKLVLGCKAIITEDGSEYFISSSGTWNKG